MNDILNGVELEGSDLDSLMLVDVPDENSKNTGNVNEDSVPEKKVYSDDDEDDDDDEDLEMVEVNGQKVEK